ncbi:sulfate adenylyltransferase subunit 2 [Limimonas halophila]|uniref:Sulfate adenylyltransferase subunit 2 n=1 Tax=Limimonas halophila TaxID=1082479 RepID=A0A1G7P3G6_9PROT|nr:sulfate adenylyltransferase subunit CysD [Limimonas halophila]SDF80657.1 sulfate adenylyltransferase subunit 2 [Limimonas halophila]
MQRLDQLEAQSVYILREAYANISPLGMLWSLGKDSNVMVWLCKKAFGGHVPFPVIHVDTEKKFQAMYEFRDGYSKEWGLNLQVYTCPPIEEVDPTLPHAARSAARKTEGLKRLIREYGYRGIIAGIRRDEQATRAKERVFSPRDENMQWDFRDQPLEFWDQFKTDFPPESHVRIHPLMNWTEVDIWRYVQRENIPVVPLYFAKDGWRYRSLGDHDITHPVQSDASSIEEIIAELETTKAPERAGRAMDHESEDAFERLRSAGYM